MLAKKHLPKVYGGVFIALVAIGLGWLIYSSVNTEVPKKQKPIQEIKIITPPPPPPPPEEPPPPPEKEKVEVPEPEPEPLEDVPELDESLEPPPADMDESGPKRADGSLRSGKTRRPGDWNDPNKVYANELRALLELAMADDDRVRQKNYSVRLNLWIDFSGAVTRAELVSSTGDEFIDGRLVEIALEQRLPDSPPPNMEQPIKIRYTVKL